MHEELLKDAREKDNEGFKFWGIAIFIETFELGGTSAHRCFKPNLLIKAPIPTNCIR